MRNSNAMLDEWANLAATQPTAFGLTPDDVKSVVVFVPLAFIVGVYGQFFAALSWSLSIAVLVSMVISLTLVPVVAAKFLAGRLDNRFGSGGETLVSFGPNTIALLENFAIQPDGTIVLGGTIRSPVDGTTTMGVAELTKDGKEALDLYRSAAKDLSLRGACDAGARGAKLAGADLTGADLTGADLGGADLTGMLWSVHTEWPGGMAKAMKARSEEVGPGIWRVVGSGTGDAEIDAPLTPVG
jgi:hypothetical protein